MENRSYALIAGVFTVLLGFTALVAVWWFSGRTEDMQRFIVFTDNNVTGLNVQGQVRYRGIRVGRVEQITLDPESRRTMLITISVRSETPVTYGTFARLGYQGVTGIAHIMLDDPGNDERMLIGAQSADEVPPRIPMKDSLINEFSNMGGEALRNVQEMLRNVNALLSQENMGRVERILINLEASSVDAKTATNRLSNLLAPENTKLLHSTLVTVERSAEMAEPVFIKASNLMTDLQSIVRRVDTALDDANANKAVELVGRLNKLTTDLSANSQQLNRVLQMLEDSPQSLIFGREGGRPGPGEPGFSSSSSVDAESEGQP